MSYSVKQYVGGVQIAVDMKKLMPDEVSVILSEYQSARRATQADRLRFIRNKRTVLSLEYDAWDDQTAADLLAQGREPKSYNLVHKYWRGITGNYIMNSYDPRFVDREDTRVQAASTIAKLNRIWYADKEHFNYSSSHNTCIEDGVMGLGVEELTVVRTPDEPRGRISFNPIPGEFITLDPDAFTDRVSRQAQRCWKDFYLSSTEMIQYFPWMDKEIREKIKEMSKRSKEAAEDFQQISVGYFHTERRLLGSKHRVTEYYHFEMTEQDVALDTISGMTLPETEWALGSPEDFMAKQVWAASKGLILSPPDIKVITHDIPVLWCTTFCPDLGIILENRKDERQLNGHLPFYAWSYVMKSGKFIGIPDYLYHAQEDFNKRELAKTKIMAQSPIAGKTVIHPLAFGENQSESKLREAVAELNDCSKPLVLDRDAPPNMTASLVHVMQGSQVPGAIFQDQAFKLTLMDSLANFLPALQGQTERSGESGLHYGRKVMEGLISHRMPLNTILQHSRDKFEDWVYMAIKLYGGRNKDEKIANYNRTFQGSDGDSVTVNDYRGDDDNGNPIIVNDLSELRRVDVLITESKENDFQRQATMEVDSMMMNNLKDNPDNDVVIAAFLNSFIKSQPYADEEQKKAAYEAVDLRQQIATVRAQARLLAEQNNLKAMQNPQQNAPPKNTPSISIPYDSMPQEAKDAALKQAGLPSGPAAGASPAGGQQGPPGGAPTDPAAGGLPNQDMATEMGRTPLQNQAALNG